MFNVLVNSKGFSLVSAMVGAAVGGIVMVAFSQMMISQQKNVSYLEDRMSRIEVSNLVTSEFTNPATCLENFKNQLVQPVTDISVVKDLDGKPLFNVKNEHDYLKIKDIKLRRVGRPIGANDNDGRMRLEIQLDRLRSGSDDKDRQAMAPIALDLRVVTDSARRIISCSLLENGREVSSVSMDSCVMDGVKETPSGGYMEYKQIIPDGHTMLVYGQTNASLARLNCGVHTVYSYLTVREVSCSKSLISILSDTVVAPQTVVAYIDHVDEC